MGNSKTCLIHGPEHSPDECKVLGDFGSKYAKTIHNKDCGNNTVPRHKFSRYQDNNAIFNSAVDKIFPPEM